MLQESISQFRLLFRGPPQRLKFPIEGLDQGVVVIRPTMNVSLWHLIDRDLNLPKSFSE